MGEVHADNIETSVTEHVNLLSRVGLGTDGTDDRSTAVVALGLVLGVEACEPLDLVRIVSICRAGNSSVRQSTIVVRVSCEVLRGDQLSLQRPAGVSENNRILGPGLLMLIRVYCSA